MKPYCQALYKNIIGRLTSNNGYFTSEIKKNIQIHSKYTKNIIILVCTSRDCCSCTVAHSYVEYSAMGNCALREVQTGSGMISFWGLDINLSYFVGFSLGCIFCQKLDLNTRNKQCPSFGFCTLGCSCTFTMRRGKYKLECLLL